MGEKTKKTKPLDIGSENKKLSLRTRREDFFYSKNNKNFSILFSKGRRFEKFFTEDSKLYITPREMKLLEKGVRLDRRLKKWDNLSSRIISEYEAKVIKKNQNDILLKNLKIRLEKIREDVDMASKSFLGQFSVARLWNLSIIASMLFGMFSMTMIYRYLGQGASAGNGVNLESTQAMERSVENADSNLENESDTYTLQFLESVMNEDQMDLENEISEMVKGYPIEDMVPYIAEKDRIVAAFLIGIAKKESNWGKRVPLLNGQDCYNYWGYRGIRKLMGTGGHTCFNSRKDAVDTVAKRLEWLIENKEFDTPEKMVIWKCGSSCSATGGWAAARKWIDDVNKYFEKLNTEDK